LRRVLRTFAVLASSVLAATAVTACGSSSSVGGAAQRQGCTAVADVLSDGPDPGSDPVGYAEAQVLPLHQLKLTDTKLREAVDKLATAYEAYASKGGRSLAAKVASEEKVLNAICPGAAP
jgi:hypothetical protein